MRIRVIIPNSGMDRKTLHAREIMLSAAVSRETEISVVCISGGPASIESCADEVEAGGYVLEEIKKAQAEGFDAAVIYCFSDPALDAARELVSIPVIGPGEITLSIANSLSNRFCVVTTVRKNVSRTRRRLYKYGALTQKLVSVRALDIPVIELRDDEEATRRYLHSLCKKAVTEDDADTLVLGCLGLAQYGSELEKEYGITVLDPAFIAVSYAEACARLGLRHNRRTYGNKA